MVRLGDISSCCVCIYRYIYVCVYVCVVYRHHKQIFPSLLLDITLITIFRLEVCIKRVRVQSSSSFSFEAKAVLHLA